MIGHSPIIVALTNKGDFDLFAQSGFLYLFPIVFCRKETKRDEKIRQIIVTLNKPLVCLGNDDKKSKKTDKNLKQKY